MRFLAALVAGSMFGAGLVVAGMTDTRWVQGFLDIFGAWDPTLAFVMGGAILPMMLAWWLAARRAYSLSGQTFPARAGARSASAPARARHRSHRRQARAGLPNRDGDGYGGRNPGAPQRRPGQPREDLMDIRPLTDTYAVSPQIDPQDMAAIRAAGYTTLIDNRPAPQKRPGETPAWRDSP